MTLTHGVIVALTAALIWLLILYGRTKKRLQQETSENARWARNLSSARTDLADVNARRKKLLAASTQALIIVERDYTISSANKVARQFFGKPSKHVTLMSWTRQHHLHELVEQALQGEKVPPLYFSAADQVYEAHGRSIKSNKQIVAVALAINDVTELQHLSRARRNFITNISHELRTPLASLQLLTETLLNGAINNKELAIELVGKMAAQVDMLGQLAQEVLDLSLIESGKAPLRLASYSLRTITQAQVDRLLPQVERKNLILDVDIRNELMVLVDQTMIGRVITNLVHNAIKFTDQGQIVVSAKAVNGEPVVSKNEYEGNWVQVSVSDSGMGIPADELPLIFERFYKVDQARSGQNSGTGLGLAIAKHIVEAHGGHIWAENNSDRGTIFHFTVPTEDVIEEEAPVLEAVLL